MEFRPCIDIHNGKVKQIVGASLLDQGNYAKENYVSLKNADYYAKIYKEKGIKGGHIILLNGVDSEFYEETKNQAILALKTYPNGLQIGGGINLSNACEFIEAGASHIIVTSYVFYNGKIDFERLKALVDKVGASKIVLDLSCKRKNEDYIIVTDRWQKDTSEVIGTELFEKLSKYCDEFLIHAVDVEGKAQGVDQKLLKLLSRWDRKQITYAGGVHNFDDLALIRELGNNHLNVTIGSALDLFGGNMKFEEVVEYIKQN